MAEMRLQPANALGNRRERSYVDAGVEIRVLGPLAVASGGAEVHLGGRKQRTVLALLAAEVGKAVSVDALIDGVWGEEPTPGARSTLQTYVSNLRAAIGDIIVREDSGYRLATDPGTWTPFNSSKPLRTPPISSKPIRQRRHSGSGRRSRSGEGTPTQTWRRRFRSRWRRAGSKSCACAR